MITALTDSAVTWCCTVCQHCSAPGGHPEQLRLTDQKVGLTEPPPTGGRTEPRCAAHWMELREGAQRDRRRDLGSR